MSLVSAAAALQQIIVGKNFTYGHKAAGTVETLILEDGSNFNFTVDVQEIEVGRK